LGTAAAEEKVDSLQLIVDSEGRRMHRALRVRAEYPERDRADGVVVVGERQDA
jgi:hypothetical protein